VRSSSGDMFAGPHPRRRTVVQLLLAMGLLLALGLGSLVHVHSTDARHPAAAGQCMACTLHTVVNPDPSTVEVRAAPLQPPPRLPSTATDPIDDPLRTLRIAPKTSPPRTA